MKIYCINLRRSHRRRQLMEQQFNHLKLKAEFVTAIDARELDANQLKEVSDAEAVRYAPHWLSPGIIACTLSHRLCYQKMIESQEPFALILEDDVILAPDIIEVLKSIAAQVKTNEVIMLYFQSFKTIRISNSGVNSADSGFRLMYPVNFENLGSSGAYLISLTAATKLYENEFPVRSPADKWGHFIQRGRIESLRIVIPFAAHSSMEESAVDYLNPNTIAGKLKSSISQLRLFPFYQLLRWKRKRTWKKTTRYIFTEEISALQKAGDELHI